MKNLIIFGTAAFAQVAYWYFKEDSDYNVVAFTGDSDKLEHKMLLDLPVLPFEGLQDNYPPDNHEVFVAIGYTKLNQVRVEVFDKVKDVGYKMATYIHSRVKLWPNNKFGDNTFIFEDNTIQPYVEIGDNVVLWSGNHIGHHSKIGNHCFITSHVVISGFVTVGKLCFIGVNATLRDSIDIADRTIIGAGTLILKSTKPDELYVGKRSLPDERKSSDIKKF